MGRSPHLTALRHTRKDQITPQDIPHLFRWLLNPTSGSGGGSGPDDRQSLSGEQSPVQTWENFKAGINRRLKTWNSRMRKDTKRLVKIESVTKALVEALELGASLDIAASYAGIRPSEFREWLAQGHARPRSIYGAFLSLIQEAIAKCDIKDLKVVSDAATAGEWKAAIERLKLRGYGQQSSPDKKPVNVKIVNFNFSAPPPRVTAKTIDYDTLLPVQEEPVRAIENGEEQESLSEQCEDADARGTTAEASPRHSILQETGGETPPKNPEGAVNAD